MSQKYKPVYNNNVLLALIPCGFNNLLVWFLIDSESHVIWNDFINLVTYLRIICSGDQCGLKL